MTDEKDNSAFCLQTNLMSDVEKTSFITEVGK